MSTLQKTFITAAFAAAIGTGIYEARQASRLREENQSFGQQISQLQADIENLSTIAAQAKKPASLPSDQFNELLRLRGEVGLLRRQTNELGRFWQEYQKLLSQVAATPELTNQVTVEDQFILRQTHVVDAMTTLLNAIKKYATNHNGQYPGSLDQLTASGDLGDSTFVGNLGLNDFEFKKDGATGPVGNKIILSLRVPLQRPGRPSVTVLGGISDGGVPHTSILNVGNE